MFKIILKIRFIHWFPIEFIIIIFFKCCIQQCFVFIDINTFNQQTDRPTRWPLRRLCFCEYYRCFPIDPLRSFCLARRSTPSVCRIQHGGVRGFTWALHGGGESGAAHLAGPSGKHGPRRVNRRTDGRHGGEKTPTVGLPLSRSLTATC